MKPPRSLCLALSTICGKSSLNPRTEPLIACTTINATTPITSTIASTSTVEHRPRLQPNRRSIAVTTGERTATLKSDTKMTRRTLEIEASAHATAATPATSSIVRRESETLTSRPPVSLVPESGSATVTCSS